MMNKQCQKIQVLLSQDRSALAGSKCVQAHIADCESCYSFLENIDLVDTALEALDKVQPSDEVVLATLQAIESEPDRPPLQNQANTKSAAARAKELLLSLKERRGLLLVTLTICFLYVLLLCTGGSIDRTLMYLEGTFGAFFLLLFGIGAIVLSAKGNYRGAAGLCTITFGLFVLRSTTATFFNDTIGSGIGGISTTYNDTRVGEYERQSPRKSYSGDTRYSARGAGALGKQEAYQDLVGSFKQQLDKTNERIESFERRKGSSVDRERIEELSQKLSDNEERTSQIFKKILERIDSGAHREGDENFPAEVDADSIASFGALENAATEGREEEPGDDNTTFDSPSERTRSASRGLSPGLSPSGALEEDAAKLKTKVYKKALDAVLESDLAVMKPTWMLTEPGIPIGRGLYQKVDPSFSTKQQEQSAQFLEGTASQPSNDRKNIPASKADLLAKDRLQSHGGKGQAKSTFTFRRKDQSATSALPEPDSLKNYKTRGISKNKKSKKLDDSKSPTLLPPLPRQFARVYLDERRRTTDLSFQSPTGYWSNTYVPGDSFFRLLQAELKQHSAQKSAVRPDIHSSQPSQPFDSPENAALATFIHSEKTTIDGETRMLVQVGLKATERHAGARSPMNIGVVLDLRSGVNVKTARMIRGLINALHQSKEMGDKFSVVVAGRPGGLLVKPDSFRHGPIQVALQELFEDKKSTAPVLNLQQAMSEASQIVSSTDDPNAPLGSSAIILVTSDHSRLPNWLSGFAHGSAVAGIPVSAVAINSSEQELRSSPALDSLVLAGQGRRRIMAAPIDAKRIIDSELQAISRVVARAVRLRVRLAPGVKLVKVFGSKKLGSQQAARVKEAEKSIDLRLSRNLGITADRGEDEEGIQIIIPAFYAGDSHIILLDVVANTPGAVADVTARYKDLVHLRNGISRSTLALGRLSRKTGPLELNVMKNLLAYELSRSLTEAGVNIGAYKVEEARQNLVTYLALQDLVMESYHSLERDQDLSTDRIMLSQFLNLIETAQSSSHPDFKHLSYSLRLAGYLKVTPEPISID